MVFDETSLRAEIVKIWGPAGAHVDVYDTLLSRLKFLEEEIEVLKEKK